jgi:hypothetical protein
VAHPHQLNLLTRPVAHNARRLHVINKVEAYRLIADVILQSLACRFRSRPLAICVVQLCHCSNAGRFPSEVQQAQEPKNGSCIVKPIKGTPFVPWWPGTASVCGRGLQCVAVCGWPGACCFRQLEAAQLQLIVAAERVRQHEGPDTALCKSHTPTRQLQLAQLINM